jgi:hypothetical protein
VPKDTHRAITTDLAELELPEQVTVAVAELAGVAREGLLALAVGTGLQVLQVMLAADVARLVGPKGRHNPHRSAVRHRTQPGRSPSAAGGSGSIGRGCAAPTAPGSSLCRPGRHSPPPS